MKLAPPPGRAADAPRTWPTVDQYNLQEMLDKLDLAETSSNANEAAWVGHFNAPLDQCAYANALRWTAATSGHWHLMHEASAIYRLKNGNAFPGQGDRRRHQRRHPPQPTGDHVAHDRRRRHGHHSGRPGNPREKVVIPCRRTSSHKLSSHPRCPTESSPPAGKRPRRRGSRPGSGSADRSSRSSPTPRRTSRFP